MRICFLGSSYFSVPSLLSIKDRVSAVVTKKAKPKGRGYVLEDNEVKKCALSLGLPVIELDSFREESSKKIFDLELDLLLSVSFGLIVPQEILNIPKIGALNVHPSLLPKYRGPSPIQAALLNGDRETGITIIKMEKRMDAGNILYQETVTIDEEDDSLSLSQKLSVKASQILPRFIEEIEKEGLKEGVIQDENLATYTKPIRKEMAKIDWTRRSTEIVNLIRAYAGWPVAYTYLDGKVLKIHKARVYDLIPREEPGRIMMFNREGIVCSSGNGAVLLVEVQLENRKRMSAYDFANGYRGILGKTLT
jgi:methionyl-tRNA formyltransferase